MANNTKGKVMTPALVKKITDQQKKYIDNVATEADVEFAQEADIADILTDFNVED